MNAAQLVAHPHTIICPTATPLCYTERNGAAGCSGEFEDFLTLPKTPTHTPSPIHTPPPVVAHPTPEPPKWEPPKHEPEPPKWEPTYVEPPKHEPTYVEPPKHEPTYNTWEEEPTYPPEHTYLTKEWPSTWEPAPTYTPTSKHEQYPNPPVYEYPTPPPYPYPSSAGSTYVYTSVYTSGTWEYTETYTSESYYTTYYPTGTGVWSGNGTAPSYTTFVPPQATGAAPANRVAAMGAVLAAGVLGVVAL